MGVVCGEAIQVALMNLENKVVDGGGVGGKSFVFHEGGRVNVLLNQLRESLRRLGRSRAARAFRVGARITHGRWGEEGGVVVGWWRVGGTPFVFA